MTPAFPKTLFVYQRGGIDTAEIRGKQIARELGSDAIERRHFDSAVARKYQVVVYVKVLPSADVMRQVRRDGIRQVLDVLDNYSKWGLSRKARLLDAFIAANLTHQVHLETYYKLPAVEIPHHHCNLEERRIPWRSGKPVIGFISTPAHLSLNEKLAKKTGYPTVTNVSRKGPGGFEHLIDTYLKTDIGIAYRMDKSKLRFNCANKLTNCMSFGIPSVLTPETGYLQFAKHGETALFAHDQRDFVDLIKWLGEDETLRGRMGESAYEAAKPFHIRNVAGLYRKFLSSV